MFIPIFRVNDKCFLENAYIFLLLSYNHVPSFYGAICEVLVERAA